MARRKNDFEEFMEEVEQESAEAGETDVLRAYAEHFRLAVQLLTLRKQRGLTQQQLAKVSGIQQSEISRIERGQGNPTWQTLAALAAALKTTVGFAMKGASARAR